MKYIRSPLRVTRVQDLQHQLLLRYCQSHTGFTARNSRVWRQWQKAFADFCITLLCTVLSFVLSLTGIQVSSSPSTFSEDLCQEARLLKETTQAVYLRWTFKARDRVYKVESLKLWYCFFHVLLFYYHSSARNMLCSNCTFLILTYMPETGVREIVYYCSTTSNQLPSSSVHFTQQQTWFNFFLSF